MFPNSYSFNPGVVLDPVTMTPMIGGTSFTVNPFGVPGINGKYSAKPQQKVWQKMFIKEIPLECSNQNMIKLLKEFGDIKNYKRTNNSRGELLPFCYFDLETGEQILRLKRLFKNIRLLDKTLQLRISQETQNFIKEWITIQKDQWRKKLIAPEMNESKEYNTLEDFLQKDDRLFKDKIEEKLRQINVDVKKAAFERMREEEKKEHPKQKERQKKRKRVNEELQKNFHQSEDYWIKRERGKEKQYKKQKEKEKQREKAKFRKLQRQIDLDSEEQQKRIEKYLTPERIKMINKEEEEDLMALEEENPPLPEEQLPIAEEKRSKFYLGQQIQLGQQTIKEVVVKMVNQQNNEIDEEPNVKVNEMFENWEMNEEKPEQKRMIDLKLPELPENNKDQEIERRRKIAELEDMVPKNKRDLWQYSIDWDLLSKSVVLIKNIRPWLEQQSYEYMGSMEEKFVGLVEKKIFSRSHPDKIIKIISQLIDDDAEQFVIKLWKRIVLEFLKLQHGIN